MQSSGRRDDRDAQFKPFWCFAIRIAFKQHRFIRCHQRNTKTKFGKILKIKCEHLKTFFKTKIAKQKSSCARKELSNQRQDVQSVKVWLCGQLNLSVSFFLSYVGASNVHDSNYLCICDSITEEILLVQKHCWFLGVCFKVRNVCT